MVDIPLSDMAGILGNTGSGGGTGGSGGNAIAASSLTAEHSQNEEPPKNMVR